VAAIPVPAVPGFRAAAARRPAVFARATSRAWQGMVGRYAPGALRNARGRGGGERNSERRARRDRQNSAHAHARSSLSTTGATALAALLGADLCPV
jgi:hypothetical protein